MTKDAMNKEQIIQAVTPAVEQRGCFLVEVSVSAENDIEIVIEKKEGVVDWEDCAAIDQVMHAAFNQDEEDYALTVSSAGLDRPFKVFEQFLKAKGTKVRSTPIDAMSRALSLLEGIDAHIVERLNADEARRCVRTIDDLTLCVEDLRVLLGVDAR